AGIFVIPAYFFEIKKTFSIFLAKYYEVLIKFSSSPGIMINIERQEVHPNEKQGRKTKNCH
ncbi:hypothetical protein, partial [Listeria monocytogenes]